jgi:hypothetical protein
MQALHASSNHKTACQLSCPCARSSGGDSVELGGVRGLSKVVARVAGKQGSGERPTALRQDKNREVRRGRTVEERRPIRDSAQGARKHDSLPIRATRWTFKTMRTSCAWRCPLNEVVRAAPDGLQTPSHDRLARRCRTGRGPVKARAARDAAMPACGLDCRRAGPADWPPSGHGLP